jgi:hypothetical protein
MSALRYTLWLCYPALVQGRGIASSRYHETSNRPGEILCRSMYQDLRCGLATRFSPMNHPMKETAPYYYVWYVDSMS